MIGSFIYDFFIFLGFFRFPRNRLFWSILVGFRGSGGLPLDSQHPGDSFPQNFSPRSSISTLFDQFLMILDDSRMLRKPLGPSLGFRKPPVEQSGLMTAPSSKKVKKTSNGSEPKSPSDGIHDNLEPFGTHLRIPRIPRIPSDSPEVGQQLPFRPSLPRAPGVRMT